MTKLKVQCRPHPAASIAIFPDYGEPFWMNFTGDRWWLMDGTEVDEMPRPAKPTGSTTIALTATPTVKVGDTFTIAGDHAMKRNPDRRWWQWWKPRMVATDQLREWECIE